MNRLLVALALSALVSCAHGGARRYHMPLAGAEAPLLFPALAAAAERLGYTASQSESNVWVKTSEGARLVWYANASIMLEIGAPRSQDPAVDPDLVYRQLKVKADEVWDLAIELRQKNNVGGTVLVGPQATPPPPPGGARMGNGMRPPVAAPAGSCRSHLDCSPGWCRDWRGSKVCMSGEGGAGAPCSSSLDCGSGLFCRGDTCG